MTDNVVVEVKMEKPAMDKATALSWISSTRLVLVIVLGFGAFANLASAAFGLNKPGWGYDVADVLVGVVSAWLAYSFHKNLKRVAAVLSKLK